MGAFARGFMGCLGVFVALLVIASLRPTATITLTPTIITASPTAVVANAAPAARIGDVVEAGNWRYRVMQVDTETQVVWSTFGNKETAKGIFVLVMLDLTNLGSRNFSINTWDFELHDSRGIRYDPASLSSSVSRARGHVSLGEQMPPGVTSRTTLLFDVAPGTTGMILWLEQADRGIRLE